MKKSLLFAFCLLTITNSFAQDAALKKRMDQDWPNLKRYRAENEKIQKETSETYVVFMGNSITEGWINQHPEFFKKNEFISRGISGQTTPQMLIRFMPDVIELNPKAVVILAGTNDIAGNTGFSSVNMITDNIKAMAQLAEINGIEVILSSILPVYQYPWSPSLEPVTKIMEINTWLKNYAQENNHVYLDYYTAMRDEKRGLPSKLSEDGVHPNSKGYAIMEPLVKEAIHKALSN